MTRNEFDRNNRRKNRLADKLRAGRATRAEEAEYERRDRIFDAHVDEHYPQPKWGSQFGDRTCEELGLMP